MDPRGGHNRFSFHKDFFKRWSDEMAYVLGFLFADGNVIDATQKSNKLLEFIYKDKKELFLEKKYETFEYYRRVRQKDKKTLK